MYKVVILILSLVCGVRVGKAVEALPETTVASSFQLYQELGLRGEVNFPAFEQALKGFSRYASGQDRLLVLIDYTKPSTEKRFYILDLLQKKLLLSTYVAHGRGSGDNARERAIVVHGANYADPAVLKGQQRLGRSLGCPALPPDISKQVIDTIKGGVLLYIYGLNKA